MAAESLEQVVDRVKAEKRRPQHYFRWLNMMLRCYDAKNPNFKNYGARGIFVCATWHDPTRFDRWCRKHHEPGLEIDRIDNDSGYRPSNCRFVTRSENCLNKRRRKFCQRGHQLTPFQECQTCKRARHKEETTERRKRRRALERVTGPRQQRKVVRCRQGAPANHLKTHCPQGHPYAGENLYVNPRGKRLCKICS